MKNIIISSVFALMASSCAIAPSHLGMSLISDTTEPVLVTANSTIKGSKTGEACGKNILGIFSYGDSSIEAARKAGNISKITTIDKKIKNNVFTSEVCTIVRGR